MHIIIHYPPSIIHQSSQYSTYLHLLCHLLCHIHQFICIHITPGTRDTACTLYKQIQSENSSMQRDGMVKFTKVSNHKLARISVRFTQSLKVHFALLLHLGTPSITSVRGEGRSIADRELEITKNMNFARLTIV